MNAVLLACGDVGPTHEPMGAYSELVRPILAGADLRFANVERLYSLRGRPALHITSHHSRVQPELASVIDDCGFDVIALASNHALDWGEDALVDTVDLFERRGIATLGAGVTLSEARKPRIVERNGVKIAFLAYCSVIPEGYAARNDRAGIVPLRAHTYYEAFDYQAGVPPRVVTEPYAGDLEAALADIVAAKQLADSVVVSFHWGIHFIPRTIADYQRTVAHAVIDAGADLILGHHAHAPKAIEVYKGKVCFYSLGNFIMSFERSPQSAADFIAKFGPFGVALDTDPAYARLAYGVDGKRSLLAKATFTPDGIAEVAFLPVLIDRELRPEVLRNGDERFADALRFMEWVSEGFAHTFTVHGNEIVIG